jgi:hypothetical protein
MIGELLNQSAVADSRDGPWRKGLQALRSVCPWPAARPVVVEPPPVAGWLDDNTRELLARGLSEETRLVVELGGWVGLSTRFIADQAPHATVITIDHWLGSPEHHQKPEWKAMLPNLFETFLALCWDYRHRIVPLRMTTLEGMRLVASMGLAPDLIYVDAEHSYEAVTGDLELIHELFPDALVVGDDYGWSGVAPALDDAVRRHGWTLEVKGTGPARAWCLVRPETDGAGEDGSELPVRTDIVPLGQVAEPVSGGAAPLTISEGLGLPPPGPPLETGGKEEETGPGAGGRGELRHEVTPPASVLERGGIEEGAGSGIAGAPLGNRRPPAWNAPSAQSVDCASVRVEALEPRYLTFLYPSAETGLYPFARIVDDLARLRPEIPILIVDRSGSAALLYTCGIDPTAHGNLHVTAAEGDPRRYLSVTRAMLLPWLAPELSPAPAVEAMINGIPVIASDRPSVVEALGRSGMIVPLPRRLSRDSRALPTSAEVAPWIDAIARLWDDPVFYSEQSRLALAEAERLRTEVDGRPRIACPPAPPVARTKSAVLVPYLDRIEPDCERALYELEGAGVRVIRKPGCSAIDVSRCELVSDALHDGVESILFVDSDISFNAADALRILARPEPVIAGVYAKKNQRELACIFADEIKSVVFGVAAPHAYPLKYASAGFLRIQAAVLRHMIVELKLPLCNTPWGRGFWPFFMPTIIPVAHGALHYLAEDWAFCHRLRLIGVNPVADTSIRLLHVGHHGFGWEEAGIETYRYRTYNYFL